MEFKSNPRATTLLIEVEAQAIKDWAEELPSLYVYSWWDDICVPVDVIKFMDDDIKNYPDPNTIRLTDDEGNVYIIRIGDLCDALHLMTHGEIKYVNAKDGQAVAWRLLNGDWDVADLDVLMQAAAFGEMTYS